MRVKMEGLRCPVCGKLVEEGSFCPLHSRALTNLREAFKVWGKAYGGRISLRDYLKEIVEQPETGEASRELALRILKGEIEWDEG
ncbi:MAG: hypothetical protein QW569_00115 [Candidatus Bathyarchaeia archaeon]|nr:hypothetical protein [Candidatus Bathyarchaeota archaeon]